MQARITGGDRDVQLSEELLACIGYSRLAQLSLGVLL